MKPFFPTLLIALALTSWGCAAESVGDSHGASTPRETTDCAVEGFGTLPAGDEFDGVASGLPDGFAEGTWVHLGPERVVDDGDDDDLPGEGCRGERRGHREGRGEGHDRHEGRGRGHHCGCDDGGEPETTRDRFEGDVETIFCSINGSRIGTATGSGSWNGDSGYTFELFVNDGGPTNDEYTFTVYDSSGGTVYTVNGFPDTGDLTVTDW